MCAAMHDAEEKNAMQHNAGSADKACSEIRRLVINYKYRPGDRLYETALAEDMAMSRTPIREALTRLVSCGFLERDPRRRGYRVPSLSSTDMQAVFRLRLLLEGYATRLAARRVTSEDIESLYVLNDQERKFFFEENRTSYSALNEKFHFMMATKSGEPYLARYIEEMLSRATLYGVFFGAFYIKVFRGSDVNSRLKPAYVEHRAVIDALAEGDGDKAVVAIRDHLLATYTHYTGHRLDEVLPDMSGLHLPPNIGQISPDTS